MPAQPLCPGLAPPPTRATARPTARNSLRRTDGARAPRPDALARRLPATRQALARGRPALFSGRGGLTAGARPGAARRQGQPVRGTARGRRPRAQHHVVQQRPRDRSRRRADRHFPFTLEAAGDRTRPGFRQPHGAPAVRGRRSRSQAHTRQAFVDEGDRRPGRRDGAPRAGADHQHDRAWCAQSRPGPGATPRCNASTRCRSRPPSCRR